MGRSSAAAETERTGGLEADSAAAVPRADGGAGGPAADRPPRWLRAGRTERIVQAGVAAALAALVGLGQVLTPSPSGVDTHTQLGLPPCGMLRATGRPCPTCGVTTSFVLAARGRLGEALRNQPFGLLCFLLAVGGLVFALVTLATGRSWYPVLARVPVLMVVIIFLILMLAAWAYKWSIT